MSEISYLNGIAKILERINNEQQENIKSASSVCATAIASGKLVHLFGSGHSVLPVQDVFPRYGGLVGWHPCMDPRLMWNNVIGPGGARELLWIERQEGYVANFLQSYSFQEGEVMIVFSHGGLNAAPIEAAMYAKEHGLFVIAITSGENYKKAEPSHSSGKKLGDVAHILIDNCCPLEDALVEIPGYYQKVGASSTIAAIAIAQSIASETALLLERLQHRMQIFVSPNVTEIPKEYMQEVYASYRKLVFDNSNM